MTIRNQTPTSGDTSGGKKKELPWIIATFVVGLLAIVATVWGIVDARDNRQKIVESQQKVEEAVKALRQAEARTSAAEAQVQKEREEKEKLQKVNIDRLLDTYTAHLNALQSAFTAWEIANRLPLNPDTAPRKTAAEQQLYNEVASFEKFVARWRSFAETLGKILDGVDRMGQARDRRNPQDIRAPLDILRRSFPDLKQQLEVQLSQIASG